MSRTSGSRSTVDERRVPSAPRRTRRAVAVARRSPSKRTIPALDARAVPVLGRLADRRRARAAEGAQPAAVLGRRAPRRRPSAVECRPPSVEWSRTRPGSGGPTRAGGRCTRARCSPASGSRSSRRARAGCGCGRRGRRRAPGFGERRGVDVPLVGQERLDRDLGAVAVRDGVDLLVDAVEPALLARRGSTTTVARLVAVEARRGRASSSAGVDARPRKAGVVRMSADRARAGVHDVDRRQAVALADLPVVEVVRRGDLDRAGALRRDRRRRRRRSGSSGRRAAGGRSCRRGGA